MAEICLLERSEMLASDIVSEMARTLLITPVDDLALFSMSGRLVRPKENGNAAACHVILAV